MQAFKFNYYNTVHHDQPEVPKGNVKFGLTVLPPMDMEKARSIKFKYPSNNIESAQIQSFAID